MSFTASLRSELLKTKRTSLVYLVLITAFIIPFIMSFDLGSSDNISKKDGWTDFYAEGLMVMVFAFLPLFFVLASTLLIQIEVRNNTWKQVLVSPQLYFDILLAKFVVLQLLGIAFLLVSNIYFIVGAGIVDLMMGTNFISYLERWPEIMSVNGRAYVATLGISALTFWLAVRSKNFITPVGIGLLLWLTPVAALEFRMEHIDKFVFALPFTVIAKKFKDEQLFHQLLSVAYCIVFFVGAYLEFLFRRVNIGMWLKRAASSKNSVMDERVQGRVSPGTKVRGYRLR